MPFDPLHWIDDELEQLQQQHLLRHRTIRGGKQGARIVLDGQSYVNFGSNDYLGLAAHEQVIQAVQQSLPQGGWGSGASPLITGRSSQQAELERHLAALEQTESALVFPSGFAANAGTLPSLAGREDVIFSDAKNHASLIDGCRLSRATVRVYPHGDVDALRQELQTAARFRRRLIVTDSLFSMDGDLAPLGRLAQLAEDHDAILVVDEAHATGVFGEHGRGVCELLEVEEAVPVRIGTLSKAIGSVGGFVAGSRRLTDWLLNRARPYFFSTAQPAATCAAALAALKVIKDEPQRRRQLLERASQLRTSLIEQGWNVSNSQSQIMPLVVGRPEETIQLATALRAEGILAPAIRPPTVPANESLLRISLSYGHTEQQRQALLEQLAQLRPSLRSVEAKS